MQYIPYLERCGHSVQEFPLFDDAYLAQLYGGGTRSALARIRHYAKRIRQLRALRGVDLIWLEYELLPFIPRFLEELLSPSGLPYVVDYDDAIFHRYDAAGSRVVRAALGKKIDSVMAGASAVVCGNAYLAERARSAGAQQVDVIPTVVDVSRYTAKNDHRSVESQYFTIGWIGSPSTQHYVLAVKRALQQLNRNHRVPLRLIGASPEFAASFPNVPVEVVEWSESSEAESIRQCDIGIMPLPDEPWARGKCGYKLIQYMAAGVPVVASPVGVNRKILKDWDCGLLADSSDAWIEAIRKLIDNEALRSRFGCNGRRAVEQCFSVQAQAPALCNLLERCG